MQHAKKLMLVDPRLYRPNNNALQHNSTSSPTPPPPSNDEQIAINISTNAKRVSTLDEEIKDILESSFSDDLKSKLYIASLNKFKYRSMEAGQSKPDKDSVENKEQLVEQIVQSVDAKKRHLAHNLLRYVNKDPDIDWSSRGELIYKGAPIANSHAVEIFNDILSVSNKNSIAPVGSYEFAQSLRSLNVPQRFIVNKARFKAAVGRPLFQELKTDKKEEEYTPTYTPKQNVAYDIEPPPRPRRKRIKKNSPASSKQKKLAAELNELSPLQDPQEEEEAKKKKTPQKGGSLLKRKWIIY